MRAHITGVGEAGIGRAPDQSIEELICAAASAAVEDAGIGFADVDALITTIPRADPLVWHADAVASLFGVSLRSAEAIPQGGAGLLGAVQRASLLAAGTSKMDTVLVISADKLLTGVGRAGSVGGMADTSYRNHERVYGPTVPAGFALMAQRYLWERGATHDALSHVALQMRANAIHHPHAQMRKPLDLAEARDAPPIAEPLRLYDCSLISDGAGAILVRAGSADERGVEVLGFGEAHGPSWVTDVASAAGLPACRLSGERAFEAASLAPSDVDVALLYDPFTIVTLVALEDLRLCRGLDPIELVMSGGIGPNGPTPVNPHGGLLSHAHPGRPGALLHVIEAVRQLRGDALGVQLDHPRVALVAAEGAMLASYATMILGRRP